MSDAIIEVERRSEQGKNAMRKLRAGGWIPAVVYGGGLEPFPVQVDRSKLLRLFRAGHWENAVFQLSLVGSDQRRHAMIRELQTDPITRQILHLDFHRVVMTEKVRVAVPIELTGIAYGVKTQSGVLDFVTRELHVECLPGKIPQEIKVDVSEVHVGQHLEAKDVKLPEGVELLDEGSRVIAAVSLARVTAETSEEADEPELAGKREA